MIAQCAMVLLGLYLLVGEPWLGRRSYRRMLAALALLFWASGSLLWPMVLHVLLDLRALRVRAPAHATTGGTP